MRDLSLGIDQDPHRNRIEACLGEDGIDSLEYGGLADVVLDADGSRSRPGPRCGWVFRRQLHAVHCRDEILDPPCVATGKHEFHDVAPDLGRQHQPVQSRRWRDVSQANKRMFGNGDARGRRLDPIVRLQMPARVLNQLQGARGRRGCEKHVLRRDEQRAAIRALDSIRRLNLRQHVVTAIGGRRPFVLLCPVAWERQSQAEVGIVVDLAPNLPPLGQRGHRVARARPRALDEDDAGRNPVRLHTLRKVAAARRASLRAGGQ